MPQILVTGASGYVGNALVQHLIAGGEKVRTLDRTAGPSSGEPGVEFVVGDVLDRASVTRALDGIEVVFHLAAVISISGDPDGRVRRVNVEGVRTVAEAALAAGVERVVHCSSVHAFDIQTAGDTVTEASPRAEREELPAYDRSKAEGEAALLEVVAKGLDAVIVNPTGIIGPPDHGPSRMGEVFLAMWRKRLPMTIAGAFDWVDVRDVAATLVAAAERGRSGENYLAPGHRKTIREMTDVARQVSGVRISRLELPPAAARALAPLSGPISRAMGTSPLFTEESVHALTMSASVSGVRAAAELDHRPRPTEDTVADWFGWFQHQGMV